MALIISGTTSNGVNVASAASNPLSVTSSAYITNTGGGTALNVNGNTNWTIANSGRIAGTDVGIYLGASLSIANGTIINSVIGDVSGGQIAIRFQGTGTVENAGDVSSLDVGVSLHRGGVTNQSTGTISASVDGIDVGMGSVTNAGFVTGTSGYGIYLESGGTATNQFGGAVAGTKYGIFINRGSGYVTNGGLITGAEAIRLNQGGTVGNASLAVISGLNYGISVVLGRGAVTNAGDIFGTNISGVFLDAGGSVSNQTGGTISGAVGVYGYVGSPVTVTNAGLISGTSRYGVLLRAGGGVSNQSTGTITGGQDGILGGSSTVFNAGTIGGGLNAIEFYQYTNDRLIVAPGAVFSGVANGDNPVGDGFTSTLELASGASAGQISGLGTEFTGFAQVTVDTKSQWTLTGANTLAAGTTLTDAGVLTILDGGLNDAGSVIDNALIQEDAAALTVGTLTGTGRLLIGGGGTLTLTGSVAAGATIDFAGTGLLALVPTTFFGQIDGLGGGGRIELTGIDDATSAAIVNANTLAIAQSAGPTLDLTLDPSQSYAGVVFPIATLGGIEFVDASDQVGPTVIDQGETESMTGAAASALAAVVGGVGGITVTGTQSLLTTTTGLFIAGDTGLGELSIEAAGTVNALGGLLIANTAGAAGSSVEVVGAGSSLAVTGGLTVGEAGSGSLSMSLGASATAGALVVAAAVTGDGDVSLAGTGTTLDVTGALTLGAAAAGELSILGGARMTVAGGVVGSSDTAPGDLDVEGAGSRLAINTGTLSVGANGPAEFTLGIGATLSGEVANGPFGVVNEYGEVDPPTDPNDGTQNVGFGNSLIYDFFVANSGTIKITSGTATFYTPLVTDETNAADGSTNGLWVIGAHDTLVMNTTSVDNTQTFDFTSSSAASLVIGQVPQASTTEFDTFNGQTLPSLTGSIAPGAANVLPGWNAPIENYQSGDLIVLQGLTYRSATASGDVVTLWSGGGGTGSPLGGLTFVTKSGAPSSTEAAAAAGQINALACFAAGTRIETARGLVAVERLRVGGHVIVHDGRCEPIVWVGSRTVDCRRHPRPGTVWPVRIARGAFGENVPARDLFLSPDHAVYVDGMLVPVKLLINGTSIAQVPRDRVTYYHVELAEHALILAEGLTVESYLHTGEQANFDDTATIQLFPDFSPTLTLGAATVWETLGAAPLVISGPKLAAARRTVMRNAPRRHAMSAELASHVG